MKEKNNWYVAMIYYLIAGLAVPFSVLFLAEFFIFGILAVLGLSPLLLAPNALTIIMGAELILWIFAIWFGAMNSAKYLSKTYVINDKNKIIKIATIYFIVLRTIYFLYGIIAEKIVGLNVILFNAITILLATIFFYFFSKKYIKNTETAVFNKVV
jgi:NADH:ubiquinone oxidoreductase subunit K